MDLSKLPKLSDSSQAPQPAGPAPESEAKASPRLDVRPPIGAEVFISIAVGLLLLFIFSANAAIHLVPTDALRVLLDLQ